jgi:hypothetical protein
MTSTPEPVDPEVAAAVLRADLDLFFSHSRLVSGQQDSWCSHNTDDDRVVVVGMPARPMTDTDTDLGRRRRFHVLLDACCYSTWPVRCIFVASADADRWSRARINTPDYPFIAGSPGAPPGPATPFEFALHDDYPFPDGRHDQLVCFSYSLDYYKSGHNPAPGQQWCAGEHTVSATLSRLYAILNSPAYLGPSAPARNTA